MPAIELKAADGHVLSAWRADPAGKPKAGMVVVQEAFGLNNHIRRVADGYAAQGYATIAPALYDRIERGVETGYGPENIAKIMPLMAKLDNDRIMLDVGAAIAAVAPAGKVGIVGFCMGGRVAWLSAARLPVAAAVSYYGGGIGALLDEIPRCPVIMHFGEKDQHIPMSEVDAIRRRHPEMSVFTYPAGHGFNCDERGDYEPQSAALALERTLDFFAKELTS